MLNGQEYVVRFMLQGAPLKTGVLCCPLNPLTDFYSCMDYRPLHWLQRLSRDTKLSCFFIDEIVTGMGGDGFWLSWVRAGIGFNVCTQFSNTNTIYTLCPDKNWTHKEIVIIQQNRGIFVSKYCALSFVNAGISLTQLLTMSRGLFFIRTQCTYSRLTVKL